MVDRTGRERRIAVIVNGNAKSVTREVLATLDDILDAGDLYVSRSIGEGKEIAETVVARGYDTVLTGGGDGTFTHIVTQIVRVARERQVPLPRFGLLRLGTGNSLAWVVGASPIAGAGSRGLAADVQRLRENAGSRPLRLVEVEGILAPFCGFGIDASVLADFHKVRDALRKLPLPHEWTGGALSYAIAATTRTIPAYITKPVPYVRVVNLGADAYHVGEGGRVSAQPIRAGETIYEGRARMVSASTIPYYGFGFRVFPFADERADRMALRVTTIGPSEFIPNFTKIWRGEYQSPTSLFDYLVDRIRVEIEPSTAFQVGGDAMGDRDNVEVALSSEPIQLVDFYVPPRG